MGGMGIHFHSEMITSDKRRFGVYNMPFLSKCSRFSVYNRPIVCLSLKNVVSLMIVKQNHK